MRRARLAILFAVFILMSTFAIADATGSSEWDLKVDFQAVGDGLADDTVPLQNAFKAAITSRKPLHMPAGVYFSPNRILWDMAASAAFGVKVYGDGPRLTILKFVGGSAGLTIACSGGCRAFFETFRDFGVEGRSGQAIMRVGLEDCSDAHNESRLENLQVQNGVIFASSAALELNGFYNGSVAATLNCGGSSGACTALRLNSAQFSTFSGSQGNAGIGTYLTGSAKGTCGYTYGNTFTAIDYEMLGIGIAGDSPTARGNTWIGGQMANYGKAFLMTAGASNKVINMNIAAGASGDITLGTVDGVAIDLPGVDLTGTPPMPPSGGSASSASGQTENVIVTGGDVRSVAVGGIRVCPSTPCSVVLNAGDTIKLDYAAPPSWTWRAIH